ncbi:type IV pilus biogenesis protein PilP [Caballeronia sp. LP003]|uniref:type IV pilus biogenesis protein PilP n=1 Tax=Caballeronia sp. LP003 TaxID=3038551 RepID=UPI00285B1329|nr:type IV pilus biogenesis protein PilP [Caballeronia sp. LP003]MDR5791731.1 type IV pilus biogenesis protein PilP [Caballeronia sp. LP003]
MKKSSLLAACALITGSAYAVSPAPMSNGPVAAANPVQAPAPTISTAASAPARADQPAAVSPADRLAALQGRIPELKAQAEIAELEARIRTANGSGATSSSGKPSVVDSTMPRPFPNNRPVPSAGISGGAPTIDVVSIRAYNGDYTASLQVNGSVVPVRRGDMIDGDWTVSAINASQVQLTRKGVTRVVRM